ncbi:enoyl-CoA hydratase/isomerase family protein [Streptomyces fuscichromogenes]|uniref:enoyl-CoA hydratase/isomerase family protein n=1 Tax=Streptomyces fuscichromogenes TaxID=1324013 RepID=UPI00383039F0
MDEIDCSRPHPGVVLLTLNRPERLNALTFAMFDRCAELCAELESDDSVRAVIVTGAGRGFCSGLDLDLVDRLTGMTAAEMLAGQRRWAAGIVAFRRLSVPVIAAVNGPASGAGMALALAADIRVAAPTARFNAAFVRVGLTGGDVGISWMLPRLVGLGHASDILLTGRMVDAAEAARIGLVSEVVDPHDLLDAAFARAEQITANSPFGMRMTKEILQTNVDAPSLQAAVELENRSQVLATRTADMAEALAAFREKRAPVWTGR